MKSTPGEYFQALDHIRALAAFIVFFWHFNHFNNGHLSTPLIFPLSFLTEGHTGVAIFMTLSGYLFAKLLNNRKINFYHFLWNRFIRLAPLLLFVIILLIIINYSKGSLDPTFFKQILQGIILPTLPNGGWSITVESHFYLILPFILYITNRSKSLLLLFLILAIAIRLIIFIIKGEIQSIAYWTIIGRIDQFTLGILAFHARDALKNKGKYIFIIFILFLLFWQYFDSLGGFYKHPDYPSPSALWIIIPTIEGLTYASLIAWYDSLYQNNNNKIAKFIALIGTYSYSIYLLHFFFVFQMPTFIDQYLIKLSNPYLMFLVAIPCFLTLIPISHLSYKFIEEPFLKFRKKYY